MKEREILREGELTVDGRYIEPDAITWSDEDPIPIVGSNMEILGLMKNFRRDERGRIYGETDVDARTITVDIGRTSLDATAGNEGRWVLTGGEIISGYASDDPRHNYPWSDDD